MYKARDIVKYKDVDPQENHGRIIVERAGYVSARSQIRNMMLAGQRLNEFRRGAYEFGELKDVPDDYLDKTRNPGFDPVDADRMMDELHEKSTIAVLEHLKKEKEKKDAERRNSEDSGKSDKGDNSPPAPSQGTVEPQK